MLVFLIKRSPFVASVLLFIAALWIIIALLKWRDPFCKESSFFRATKADNYEIDHDSYIIEDEGRDRFFQPESTPKSKQLVGDATQESLSSQKVHMSDDDYLAGLQNEDSLEFINLAPDADKLQEDLYEKLAKKYLAPWLPFPSSSPVESAQKQGNGAPVTQRMLNLMEYVYKGGSFRVRYLKDKDIILYRVLIRYTQTYRFDRMVWILTTLSEMRKEGLLKASFDAVFYVGDGPKVPMDTFDKFAGFPLFSLRTSAIHVDIPIPDPVVYGANGNYIWPREARLVPWDAKLPTAIFRGKASCLKMQADNWHACNRVRAAKLAQDLSYLAFNTTGKHPLFDIGITEWNQVPGLQKYYDTSDNIIKSDGTGLIPPPNPEEIEQSTGLSLAQPMDYLAQSRYKYIIDLDGGLGSSRKDGILGSSGSLLVAQESPWKSWYEPCLRPFYHYIPFSRTLQNLPSRIQWALSHDAQVKRMIEAAQNFSDRMLTLTSAKRYLATLLNIYATKLLVEKEKIDDHIINLDFCALTRNKDIPKGPLGCSQGWFQWDDVTSPVYWKNLVRSINEDRKAAQDTL
jgi:hypothetical protein